MLQTILELVPFWLKSSREVQVYAEMKNQRYATDSALYQLLSMERHDGLTPVKLAAKLGCSQILNQILNIKYLYCFPYVSIEPESEMLYDVSEIESFCNFNSSVGSVLEIASWDFDGRAIRCFEIPVITKVAQIKYNYYWKFVLIWGIFHIFIMIMNSLLLFKQGVECREDYNSSINTSDLCNDTSTNFSSYSNSWPYWINNVWCLWSVCFSIFVWISSVKILHQINEPILYNIGSIQFPFESGINFLFCSSGIAAVLANQVFSDPETASKLMSISYASGWMYLFFFVRLFDNFTVTVIMVYKILSKDLFPFTVVMSLFILSATGGVSLYVTSLHIQLDESDNNDIITKMVESGLSFFRMGIGISDFVSLYSDAGPFTIPMLMYIFFLIIVNVLLFNMLIASMSATWQQTYEKHKYIPTSVHALDSIVFERIIPHMFRSFLMPYVKMYKKNTFTITLFDGRKKLRTVYLLNAKRTLLCDN